MRISQCAIQAMITSLLVLSVAATLVVAGDVRQPVQSDVDLSVIGATQSAPLAFTQNAGQWPDNVRFRASAGGATMWFTADGALYEFIRQVPTAGNTFAKEAVRPEQTPTSDGSGFGNHYECIVIKANFVGCNANPKLDGMDQAAVRCNYFLGSDQSRWRTDVPTFEAIIYREIYRGIDLKYYGNDHLMEYDFQIDPGADYSQIQVRYDGTRSLSVNGDGELIVETEFGSVTERRPVVYQLDDGIKKELAGRYVVLSENTFTFKLEGDYNPELALVIDPVLVYSTYLGGSSGGSGGVEDERAYDIAVDAAGNAYVVGLTVSADFPTANPYDGTLGSLLEDVFITKIAPGGNTLVYSTYLGGIGSDFGRGIAVDADGNAYVLGVTASNDFPVVNAYDNSYNGGGDAFVAKLAPEGNSLVYSTYLGGSVSEYERLNNVQEIGAIAVDAAGSAYVSGVTASTDFPTVNPFDGTFNVSDYDAFVTKLTPSGDALVYSTFLGGAGRDFACGIAVDTAGNAFVSGVTTSADFPTENPFDATLGGTRDAFVTKVAPAGDSLIFSTYLGGSADDYGGSITVDASGSAYTVGMTYSSNFPTQNPLDGAIGGAADAFVTKLSANGKTLVYSTFMGGSDIEDCRGIKVDGFGCAYVVGGSTSADWPTLNAYDKFFNGGWIDAVVFKLVPGGDALVYSTFLGGNDNDWAPRVAIDPAGNAYVTGLTFSSDFPTLNAFDNTRGGACDAFVTKVAAFTDADRDGLGDADEVILGTDPNKKDSDDDSVDDFSEVTAQGGSVTLPADTDSDGLINALDPDDDNDGVATIVEFPRGDTDADGIRDYLDPDDDGDGVATLTDNCPLRNNPSQADSNGDGIGDACCCAVISGNVNCDISDGVDIGDLTTLIDNLFITFTPLCCPGEANCDGDPGNNVDIGDLTALIDNLFVTFTPLGGCQ